MEQLHSNGHSSVNGGLFEVIFAPKWSWTQGPCSPALQTAVWHDTAAKQSHKREWNKNSVNSGVHPLWCLVVVLWWIFPDPGSCPQCLRSLVFCGGGPFWSSASCHINSNNDDIDPLEHWSLSLFVRLTVAVVLQIHLFTSVDQNSWTDRTFGENRVPTTFHSF